MVPSSTFRHSLRLWITAFILLIAAQVGAQDLSWKRLNGPNGGNVLDILSDSSDNVFAFTANEFDKFDPATNTWRQLIAEHNFGNRRSAVIIRNRTDIAISHGSEWIVSYDGGNNWGSTGGGVMTDIITAGFEIGDTVYAGTASHGVVRTISRPYLSYWAQVDTSHWPVYSLIRTSSNVIYAGSFGVVYRSTDQGSTWSPISSGLPAVNVTALQEFGGALIAGTNGDGIFRWNATTSHWERLNPGVEPWNISSFAIRNGTLFVSSFDAGIFRYDGGTAWTEFNAKLPTIAVSKLFVRTNGEFLAGTTNGLFSLAADNSWEAIGLPVSQVISLVETPKHAILARCNNGLFRSSDSGEHWTDISINSTHTIIPSLAESAHGTLVTAMGLTAFRSKDGEHWTATSIGANGSSFGTVYHTGGSTFYFYNDYLYRSSNDGATWQLQDNLAQVRPIQFSGKDNLVFGANYSGIYRSRDSGAHWDSVFRRGTVISSGAFVRVVNVYDSGRYNTYASSDAGDSWRLVPTQNQYQIYASAVGSSGVYFAANAGVLRATDLSAAYTATSLTNYSTAIATNGPTVVAFDSKRGIYYSGDGGNSWHRSQGVYDSVLTLSSDAKGRYFAGTMGGIYRSEDSGKTFISSSAGLEPTALNFATTPSENGLSVARNGHAFANAIGWGLAESTDDGDHWRLIDTTNFAYSGIPFWVAPTGRIFRRPNTKSYYLAYSDDEGATWTTTDQLLLQNLAFDSVGGVVAFNGPSGSNIYVHYSSDGGAHWQEFDGLHSYGIDCRAAVDPKGQVYLCNLFFGGADGQHAVITTSNFADTTQHSVLDTVSITAIGIDRGGYVYAGASNLLHTYTYALYLSTDRGATWTNIRTTTFPEESIRSILPTDQYIYVGTDGGGLMRMRRTGTAGASSTPSSESAMLRIHPMPANTETTIDLGSSDASTISIVNSLGVCLAEYQSTGSQLNVDTRGLPSGVYSVIARSTHGTHSSRLVVKH